MRWFSEHGDSSCEGPKYHKKLKASAFVVAPPGKAKESSKQHSKNKNWKQVDKGPSMETCEGVCKLAATVNTLSSASGLAERKASRIWGDSWLVVVYRDMDNNLQTQSRSVPQSMRVGRHANMEDSSPSTVGAMMLWISQEAKHHGLMSPPAGKWAPTSLGGLEPPAFRLTAERADQLRHRDLWHPSKIWNTSWICVSSLHRGHANLLCTVPILVYVLPKWAQGRRVSSKTLGSGWQSSACSGKWEFFTQNSPFKTKQNRNKQKHMGWIFHYAHCISPCIHMLSFFPLI